ncbi:MAG: hypothetical protein AAF485_01420 [Chloroflexota bacterium]
MTIQSEARPQTDEISHPLSPQDWLLVALRLWGLILLTLHLAAPQLPEAASWSVWPYTFLPNWLGWLLALLAGSLMMPMVSQTVLRGLQRLWNLLPGKQRPYRWFALIALLSGGLFWLARLQHLKWGDSYLLSIALSYHDLELRVIYNWQAPFTVFLHQRLWQFVADPLLGWPVEYVYATTSIISGIIFIFLLLTFLSRLGRDTLETVFLVGLMVTTGSIQLFFGYVENYTLISVWLMLTLFLSWRALQNEILPVWPVLGLALTNAFHPSTVFLWPGMWLLVWLSWRRDYVSLQTALWQLLAPPFVVGGAVLALMESGDHGISSFLGVDRPGGGDGIWFVPLFETTTQWEHYTMFSADHFIDWGNIHLLISPFGIPLIILSLLTIRYFRLTIFDHRPDKDFALFLGVTAAMYILLTWLWNPDYGGRKDWDLFAPSAFVYTLFGGYLLVRIVDNRKNLAENALFIVIVSLLHTGAWIFTNTQELPRE